jgi:oligopeptide transport system ATP-binding protein
VGPLLSIEHLSVALSTGRGSFKAVDDVSLGIGTGEIVGIAGESGSGKTMTALSLLGLLPHGARTAGSALFDGTDLLRCSPKQLRDLRGRQIAMVSQDPATSLHPILTVERQLTEHMRHHLGVGKGEARTRAIDLLATVRIPDPEQALGAYPGQFSGGMRQRIAIAVALACEPRLLLADEPTTALDATVQIQILLLLRELQRETGMAVIFVTHDIGAAVEVADRIAVMYAGRIVEENNVAGMVAAPRHPYSAGLLASTVSAEHRGRPLNAIAGSPPNLASLPPGCSFAPRCAHASARCTVEVPAMLALPDARLACWHPLLPLAEAA